jgi:hypothetical protein
MPSPAEDRGGGRVERAAALLGVVVPASNSSRKYFIELITGKGVAAVIPEGAEGATEDLSHTLSSS